MIELPDTYWEVRYVGARYPGSTAVHARPGLADGANCQLFAYEVLRHFGLAPARTALERAVVGHATTPTRDGAAPLDLVLVNTTPTRGAPTSASGPATTRCSTCAPRSGRPALWNMAMFAARPSYRVLVGFKRSNSPGPDRLTPSRFPWSDPSSRTNVPFARLRTGFREQAGRFARCHVMSVRAGRGHKAETRGLNTQLGVRTRPSRVSRERVAVCWARDADRRAWTRAGQRVGHAEG